MEQQKRSTGIDSRSLVPVSLHQRGRDDTDSAVVKNLNTAKCLLDKRFELLSGHDATGQLFPNWQELGSALLGTNLSVICSMSNWLNRAFGMSVETFSADGLGLSLLHVQCTGIYDFRPWPAWKNKSAIEQPERDSRCDVYNSITSLTNGLNLSHLSKGLNHCWLSKDINLKMLTRTNQENPHALAFSRQVIDE